MKQRLDVFLVTQKLAKSRNLAQQLIKNSSVAVNGNITQKVNFLVSETDKIEILDTKLNKYVSRGGLKLEHALKFFEIKVNNKTVMDIGASTGGFTDCLIQAGARKVYAIDVGTNQLAPSLMSNPKVISYEKQNFRDFNFLKIEDKLDLIVIDVSFISLGIIFNNIYLNLERLNYPELTVIALIKPEFELNKKALNKQGLVKDKSLEKKALLNVFEKAKQANFNILGITKSPILGAKSGNREYLGLFQYKRDLKSDKISSLVELKDLDLEVNDDSTNNH